MKKRVLALLMALTLALTGLGFTPVRGAESGLVITQTEPVQQTGDIVKENLLTGNLSPDEAVEIIVELDDAPVSEIATTKQAAIAAQASLLGKQNAVRRSLNNTLDDLEYTHSYTMLLNGFAVKTTRDNLEAIRSTPGVKRAYIASSYQLPENEVSSAAFGKAAREAGFSYTGAGMTIAVLDTGLDTTHPAFSHAPEGASFSKDYVRGVFQGAALCAEELVPGVTAEDVYVSEKVPFAFDYGEMDTNVAPGSKYQATNLEHGTHVTGIAAGYDVDEEGQVLFSGVAPDAQIIAMKVFDDGGQGAPSAAVLAALEDAYILGVDAINMSLGTRCGYTVDEDETLNEIYNRLQDAGIMVIVAAGNETSSSASNQYGENLPLTDDPDNSIVASPSTYPANLSVASMEGDLAYRRYFLLGNEVMKYMDSQTSFLGIPEFVKLLSYLGIPMEEPYDYVVVPGYGRDEDYQGLDVTGKIVVVQRGGLNGDGEPMTFVEKIQNATWKRAIGIIVYNNDEANPNDDNVTMSTGYYQLPACFVSYNAGQHLAALEGTGVGITLKKDFQTEGNPAAGQMSTFTSIGLTPDLRLKPEITAVGGNVYSSVPTLLDQGGYAIMSGTSMASPYAAGASTLVKQRVAAEWAVAGGSLPEITENLMLSTAQILVDPATNQPYSPRLQGSGSLSLSAALESPAYLFTDADQYGDTKPVGNLGDDVEKTGKYTVTFYAQNMSSEGVSYDLDVLAMSPDVEQREGYALMSDKDVLLDYQVSGDTRITLAPGETKKVAVTIALTSTQKAALDDSFANGIFVEGFVRLTPNTDAPVLSLPFVAFYGDWSKPGMFDYATMLNDQEVAYSNYPTGIGAWFSFLAVKLGANLSTNELVPIQAEHLIISPNGDERMDGVEISSLGLLRDASVVRYSVTDSDGKALWTDETKNVPKTTYYASEGTMVPATHFLDCAVTPWLGVDAEGNKLPDGQYYYTIQAEPVTDHASANVRNTVTFPVYIDTVAPTLKTGSVSIHTNGDGRMILSLPFEDDHILLDACIYQTNIYSEPMFTAQTVFHENYGLADMEDTTYAVGEADVTDYAGKLVYLQVTDWGYNASAYLIEIPESVPENDLTLSEENVFLFTGNSERLFGFNSTEKEVPNLTWTSSNTKVATVDADGNVTAVAPGVSVITATTATGSSAQCVVGVEDTLEFTGLRLDYDTFTVKVPFESGIKLPGVYVEPYDFRVDDNLVTWTISDESLAEVSWGTNVTTKSKEGTVTFTAEFQGMTASFDVEIYNNTGSVHRYHKWITPRANMIFTQGKEDVVGAGRDAIYPYDEAATSEDQIISFTYDNHEAISLDKTTASATINKESPADHTFITALHPGTATITATATDTTQDTIQWMITVIAKRYDGINALQSSTSLHVGETAKASQMVEPYGENVLPEYNPIMYTSLDPEVVTVSEDGTLTAVKGGTGLIRAMLNTGDYALVSVHVEDHQEEVRNAKEATCTEDGYTGDVYCTICGTLLRSGETIPAHCACRTFTDLNPDRWYHPYVDFVVEGGIMKGMGDHLFAPEASVTRAQLVTTLYRMAGTPQVETESGFEDVATGRWYSDAIAWAKEAGIAMGVTATQFCPNASVTREQAATFLYRYVAEYLKEQPVEGTDLSAFTDASKVSGFAKKAVAWANAEGVLEGFEDSTLRPKGLMTRAQLAKILTVTAENF